MTAIFRSLSAAQIVEITKDDTRPAQLIEIAWPNATASRLCTFANITALGYDWTRADVVASNLSEDTTGKTSGTLVFGNADGVWGALALEPKFRDVPVRVWEFDAGAVADADFALRFDGCGDTSKIMPNGQVQVALSPQGSGAMFCPRGVLGPPIFNHLVAPGDSINYNGQQIVFQPVPQG